MTSLNSQRKTIERFIEFIPMRIVEPQRWWIFRVGWKIPKEKIDFDVKAIELWKIMEAGDLKGEVEKWEIQKFREAVGSAYKESSLAYKTMGFTQYVDFPDLELIEKFISERRKYVALQRSTRTVAKNNINKS